MPFHSAQFVLNEMSEEHIKEASWIFEVTGASAFTYGVDYSNEKFREELRATIEYIKPL